MPEEAAASPAAETNAPRTADSAAKHGLASHPALLWSAGLVLILLLIGALLWWLHSRNFESTDDAFVDTHIVRLATQIAGQVIAVTAEDNALVEPGQPLVLIDSADADARVAQAMAQQAAPTGNRAPTSMPPKPQRGSPRWTLRATIAWRV
jgi:membrane fusion protein (multidrug efflux system)